jgi:hypothetical protein
MKLIFAAVLAAAYLCILCGPSFFVARQAQRSGYPLAWRALRLICPSQLVATFSLLFAADALGLKNPAGLLVATTLATSLGGAAICKLLGWYAARS